MPASIMTKDGPVKVCTQCGREKPRFEYAFSGNGAGFESKCKECRNKNQNERRRNNPEIAERDRERARRWRQEHRAYKAWYQRYYMKYVAGTEG